MRSKQSLLLIALVTLLTSITVFAGDEEEPMFPDWWHKNNVSNMVNYCGSKCEEENDKCNALCLSEYSMQMENYLWRHAINLCKKECGLENIERTHFKYIDPKKNFDEYSKILSKTLECEELISKNNCIESCTSRLMDIENRGLQRLLQERQKEINDFKNEHPLICLIVKAQKAKEKIKSYFNKHD